MRRNLRVVGGSPWFFFGATSLAMPFLLFSTFLPTWSPIAAIVLLTVASLLRCYATGRVLGHTPADWALLLVLLTLPVSLWASADHHTTLPRVYAYVANLAVFWAVAALAKSTPLRWTGWGMLVASLMLTGIFLLGTHFGAAKLPFIDRHIYSILPGNFKPFWNEGGFNANLAGGVLALFLPSAMILAIAGESWLQRCIALITFAILAIMLLLAQSRGALIAVMISLPVMTILYKKHWLWFWLAIATTGVALLIVYGNEISFETILGNDSTLGDISSLQSRVELWSRAIYMIQDFPFTGVGLGMFEPVVKLLYPTFLLAPDVVFQHAHNIYFQTAAEMGIPGLIGHLALCSTLTILLVRRIIQPQQDRDQYRVIALGLFGGLLVYLVHGIFDAISFYLRTAFVIWIIFGLIVAISTSLGWNVAE